MFNTISQINWIAVALATIAIAGLGAVWFTALFGKAYITALGRDGQPPFKMTPIFMAGPFVCGLVTCIAAAILFKALGIASYSDALIFGLILGGGLLATTTLNTGINPNIPRPLLYGAVSGSYFLLTGIVISLIFALMG